MNDRMIFSNLLISVGGLALTFALLIVACSPNPATNSPATTASLPEPTATLAPVATTAPTAAPEANQTIQNLDGNTTTNDVLTPEQLAAEAVMRQFVEAINAGDATATAATFAPDARFDSVGRIYPSRDEIMNRFLIPEVINIGGQYEILGITHEPDAITFEFNFRAGSLFEHFTYRCVVRDGLIQECVGRYIQ